MKMEKKRKTSAVLLVAAITVSLLAIPIMTVTVVPAAPDHPEDDFAIPVPIATPQTPDEEFFNMRLAFFLPETEPLIKETFGTELRFEDDAFWEYESYYSRAVSFATNLPTLAKIEYGPDTQYSLTTEQTESYYYQHLFHLTGLEPGNTYHYRIKARASDGQLLVSRDYAFTTPTVPADVILIPQDLEVQSPPYKLAGNDKNYLLTQDIFAPNGGIVLGGNNVTLDLGGHTIVYDNQPNTIINEHMTDNAVALRNHEGNTSGVRCGMWNFRNQKVLNGVIIQGSNGGTGLSGNGYNPILFTHTSETEIAGVAVDYYGDSVNGIMSDADSYIHHNVVYDRGYVIDNRHEQMRAITVSRYYNNVISYNSVRRCRQTGIAGGRECRGNEIYGDSFAANSYLLGYDSDSTSTYNKIFGLGYNPIGIGGGTSNGAVARNNFIYMHAWAPSQRDDEYDRLSGVAGFRWQIYGDEQFRGVYWDNNLFTDNVIVAKAWPDSAYIRGLWLSQGQYANGNRVENNIVKVEAMSDDINAIDSGDVHFCYTCIDLNNRDDFLYSEDFDLDAYVASPSTLIAGNRLITNMSYLVCGTGYRTGSNAALYRNTFEKIEGYDNHYVPFRLGYWFHAAVNNKVIDSIIGPGVDLSTPARNATYTSSAHLALDVGVSSQRAYADAATGEPLANRTVAWRMDGGESGVFSTDGNGEAYREWMTTHNEHMPGQPGLTMAQTHNTAVTFTVDGYEPVTKNIADIKGEGPAILFGGGTVAPTAAPTATPTAAPTVAPVESLGGGAILDANTIRLTFWSYSAYDGAEIYRSSAPDGPFSFLKAETGPCPYYDTDLQPDTTYYYKIRLLQNGNLGPMTEAVALKTSCIIAEDFRGRANTNDNEMAWWCRSQWDYAEIWRSTTQGGDDFALYATTEESPFYDVKVEPGNTYRYIIRLVKGAHTGPFSDVLSLQAYQ